MVVEYFWKFPETANHAKIVVFMNLPDKTYRITDLYHIILTVDMVARSAILPAQK